MIGNFGDKIKSYFLSRGYFLWKLHTNRLAGLDLGHDLRVLIPSKTPTCLDIGANRGQTIRLFKRIFGNPRIHSFEPSSELFKALKANFSSDRVSIHNFALGDHPEEREFLNYQKSGFNSFLKMDDNADNRFGSVPVVHREMVSIKTVDDFLEAQQIPTVDLLKVDTQGFDLMVLKGAANSLASGMVKHVFVEINFIKLYEGQSRALDVFDYLQSHGFNLVDLYEKSFQADKMAWCTALFSKGNPTKK